LFVATELSPQLLAAYQATEYWVGASPEPFCLRVSQHSAALERLLGDSGCRSAAFMSAHNPFSEPRPAHANAIAHERLKRTLERQSMRLIEGVGRDSGGSWTEEKSVLALEISLPNARKVGAAFLQNAIVWAGRDAVPRLILLR
jgi:hypothetical protein